MVNSDADAIKRTGAIAEPLLVALDCRLIGVIKFARTFSTRFGTTNDG